MPLDVVISGKVEVVGPIQTYGDKGFQKKELVLNVEGERANMPIPVEFTYEGIQMVSEVEEGDLITVRADLSGRAWEKEPGDIRYFLSLRGTKVRIDAKAKDVPALTEPPF